MGILDLHWKGKSKATPSTNNSNSITSLFSRSQHPPPPTAPKWVRTPHWNEAEASSSSSSSRSPYTETEHSEYPEKIIAGQKPYRDEKIVTWSNRCEHKARCGLNTAGCCACLDKRPLKRDYVIYKDGRGLVAEGTRWGNYCPGCKAYWTKRQGKGIPEPSSLIKPAGRADSKIATPSSGSTSATPSLKPEQQPQPQGETNDPPPPYSSALSEGWEILPRYREEEDGYGGRS